MSRFRFPLNQWFRAWPGRSCEKTTRLARICLTLPCFLLVLGTALTPTCLPAQTEDEQLEIRLVKGLLERRLFDLATSHAERLQSTPGTSERLKVEMAILHLNAQIDQTLRGPQQERAASWQAVERSAANWRNQFAQSAYLILLEVQTALIGQTKLDITRQELSIGLATENTRQEAQQLARETEKKLLSAEQSVEQHLARQSATRGQKNQLTSWELLTLRSNIQYQIAKCLTNQARLYPADEKASRQGLLLKVRDRLTLVLNATTANTPLWWNVQVDRLMVDRLLRQYADATKIAERLSSEFPSESARLAVQNQRLKLAMAMGNLGHAQQVATQVSPEWTRPSQSPAFDLTRIELYIHLSDDSSTGDVNWNRSALDLAKQVGSVHGGYWARRANLLVVNTITPGEANNRVDLLILVANEASRKGEWGDAVAALERAVQSAQQQNANQQIFELRYRIAAIQQEQKQHAQAATTFFSIAMAFPDEVGADAAGLLACWNLAKTIGTGKSTERTALVIQYANQLDAVITTWPESAKANQARIWLGRVYLQQSQWFATIENALLVLPRDPLHREAIAQLAAALPPYLNHIAQQGRSTDDLFRLVDNHLRPRLETTASTDRWSETQCQIALLLVKLNLIHGASEDMDPLDLSDKAIQASQAGSYTCLPQAMAWGSIAASFTGIAQAEIEHQLKSCPATPPALAILLQGLTYKSHPHRKLQAKLLLAVHQQQSEAIQALSDAEKRAWTEGLLDAFVILDQRNQAIEQAAQLAKQYSMEAATQIRFAQLLTELAEEQSTADSQNAALTQWRRIAKQLRKNSDPWFQAKFHIASLLKMKGDRDAAKKILDYIQAIPPGWTKSSWAEDFNSLHRELE